MKFCVMTATQSDAIFHVQFPLRKQRGAKNVMRLQLFFTRANAASAIARNHLARPPFAFAPVPKIGVRLTVDKVGIAASAKALRDLYERV